MDARTIDQMIKDGVDPENSTERLKWLRNKSNEQKQYANKVKQELDNIEDNKLLEELDALKDETYKNFIEKHSSTEEMIKELVHTVIIFGIQLQIVNSRIALLEGRPNRAIEYLKDKEGE